MSLSYSSAERPRLAMHSLENCAGTSLQKYGHSFSEGIKLDSKETGQICAHAGA